MNLHLLAQRFGSGENGTHRGKKVHQNSNTRCTDTGVRFRYHEEQRERSHQASRDQEENGNREEFHGENLNLVGL